MKGWLAIPVRAPRWRKVLVWIARVAVIYAAIGLALGVLARIFTGPGAWMDLHGDTNILFAAVAWALLWPVLAVEAADNLVHGYY